MTDFDAVLERLLGDPVFQSALAADPDRALAGYDLDADERALLRVQFSIGTGSDRTVETRTTKAGVVGMLGPVASALGFASGGGGGQSVGSAPGSGSGESFGHAPQSDGAGGSGTQSFGVVDANQSFGTAGGAESLGSAPSGATIGAAPNGPPAVGYDTRIDVNGDGTWDAYQAYERADGGVDLHADINHDGVVDFVGHDDNRDGLVNSADYDLDLDGKLDTRMYDDDGDGWMDRSHPIPPRPAPPL